MIRRFAPLLAAVAIAGLTGCAHQDNSEEKARLDALHAKENQGMLAAQADKVLAAGLYRLSPDSLATLMPAGLETSGYSITGITTDGLHFRRSRVSHAVDWAAAREKMSASGRPLLDDPIAAKYIEIVRARGDTVRQFKPAMSAQVNSMFKLYHFYDHGKNTQEWYGPEEALIEYGADGHIVSALTKSWQGMAAKDVSVDEYVHVFYGASIAHHVESNVSPTLFNQAFVRDVVVAQATGRVGGK